MSKKKILFLGESYRADAITWITGLEEFGNFEVITWELKSPSNTIINRVFRIIEFAFCFITLLKLLKKEKPDMVIAERTTSYGFLAVLCNVKPVAIAQQGITDLWPAVSIMLPIKKIIQRHAFKNATLIHAWGPIMANSMRKINVDMDKVLVMPKGIDLRKFKNKNTANENKIYAVITRSLEPEYRHDIILKAFEILHKSKVDFELTIIGDGTQKSSLEKLAKELNISSKVNFRGRINNIDLPEILQKSNFYISMPTTEGVSSSLFEAMASNCYPIVTDLPGNRSWINHRENGQLVTVDDYKMLASEIIWAYKNKEIRGLSIKNNRLFVEKNANFETNMKFIADKYNKLLQLKNAVLCAD